jgi:hypothetical protein
MTIEKIKALDAYSSLESFSYYPKPEIDKQRLIPYPKISHQPKFKIKKTDKIFSIGSCFARNVEKALSNLNINTISSRISSHSGTENIINKYTPSSIKQDLQIISGLKIKFQKYSTIYQLQPNKFLNLSFGGGDCYKFLDNEKIKEKTDLFYENYLKLKKANVIIITLGLIETWYDLKRDIYLNITPPKSIVSKSPEDFELHVMDFDDVYKDLLEIYKLLQTICGVDIKLLLTVSPVPLARTFRNQDCLQANIYSKSVLRAAAEKITYKHENISYFPSYDIVFLTSLERAWIKKDFRHVQQSLIDKIMQKVISSYFEDFISPPSKEQLQRYFGSKQYKVILNIINEYMSTIGCSIKIIKPIYIRYYYAAANIKLSLNPIESIALLDSVIKVYPRHKNAIALRKIAFTFSKKTNLKKAFSA